MAKTKRHEATDPLEQELDPDLAPAVDEDEDEDEDEDADTQGAETPEGTLASIQNDEDHKVSGTDTNDEDTALNGALTVTAEVPAATGVAVPEPPKAERVPTLQMQSLGGEFLDFTVGKHAVICVRQVGSPITKAVQREVVQDLTVRGEDGKDTIQKVKKIVEDVEVEYEWADEFEQRGDPHASLTSALRAQAADAKSLTAQNYAVREYIKKEYGVWYATEPSGKLPGYRFSIRMIPIPADMVKTKPEPKEKPPKAVKPPKAEKPAKGNTPKAVKPPKPTDSVAAIVHTPTNEPIPETVIEE